MPNDTNNVMEHITNKLNGQNESFYYPANGKPISNDMKILEGDTMYDNGRLRGGAANM